MTMSGVSIKANKSEAQLEVLRIGWIPFLFGSLMLLAIFVPYLITLYRGIMTPYLPFISQAAGSPPQSGIFCIFLCLSAIVGFFGLHLLYLGIKVHQKRISTEKQFIVRLLSKLSMIPGHLSLLGMIIVGGYPIDFQRHEGEWILVTVLPHLFGSITLFAGGVTYCCILTIIMSIVLPQKKKLLALRIALLTCTITASFFHVLTAPNAFSLEYNDENRLRFCTVKAIQYDRNYIFCSLCEWLMVVSFIGFFMTIYGEAKTFSFALIITYLDDEPTAGRKKLSASNDSSSDVIEDNSRMKSIKPTRRRKQEKVKSNTSNEKS